MDQNIDKNLEFKDKLKLFFIKQKIKNNFNFFRFFIISIIFLWMKIIQEKENILISEKFIKSKYLFIF